MIYWIGGSPCAGKSTIAKRLADKYGFALYHSDEHFERHLAQATSKKQPLLSRLRLMTCDEIWLAPIEHQVKRELAVYREELPMILTDIQVLQRPLIVEGAALLPKLIESQFESPNHAVWIIPTEVFQLTHYIRRPWVKNVLVDCSDSLEAFQNWMARDADFAQTVRAQAEDRSLNLIVVDGTLSLDHNFELVEAYFGLSQ